MPFSEIRGHRRQLARLLRTLASGKLAHAYLFSGPSGIGKRTVAMGLFSSLHCEELGLDFCGVCNPCRLVLAGAHPDVHLVRPQEGKKETAIEQVRELERVLSLRSFYGKKKAVLIEESETLNYPAQNALLKTLEEPRGDTLFILLIPVVRSLLPTVVSRCHEIRFQSLGSEDVQQILLKKGFKRDRALLLSRLCQGSVGKAIDLDANGSLERRAQVSHLLECGRNNLRQVLDWAEDVCSGEGALEQVLDLLEGCLRDAMVLKYASKEVEIINFDLNHVVENIAREWSVEEVLDLFDELGHCRSALEHNAQKQFALETTLLRGLS
jgi:DNA polymerase-3 subunit delta'